MKTLLVTGDAGFIGSNFTREIVNKDIQFINLDLITYAASLDTLSELRKFKNYKFIIR